MRIPGVLKSEELMNMKCTDIDTLKDDYLDGNLPAEEQHALEQHVAECERCEQEIKFLKAMLGEMKSLPVQEPASDFESRVFGEVRRRYPETAKNHFAMGFMTAMAAGLALWFASTIFFVPQQAVDNPDVFSIAVNDMQTVKLMFESPADLEEVTLSLGLPSNIELTGYAGQTDLSWKTSLKKGQNVLALPVMAVDVGEGELVAQIKYGEKQKTYRLVLKTTANGVMEYRVQKVTAV